ncbi:MAG: Mce protein [Mycobacterium sp.]
MRNGSVSRDVFDKIVADENPPDEHVEDVPKASDVDRSVDEADHPPTTSAESLPRTGRRRLVRATVGVLAGLVFITAVGLAGVFGWRLKQQDDAAAAGRAALDVARNYAVTLTSVDNATIDNNFTQVLNGATGEFKDMYSQSAAQLRQLLIDNKAVSHGTVVDSAIKSATTNKVEVLIFVDQSISNSANPQPRIDRSRVAITMDKIDGRWLAGKVDIK